jgi:hypothetical protein
MPRPPKVEEAVQPSAEPVRSHSAPEPTPAAGLAHNADYSVLVGELHYNARQDTWRLRYAGVGEEDRYGGSVTLDGVRGMMQDCQDGQRVRIEGGLVDPESRDPSPAYRVRDLKALGPAH